MAFIDIISYDDSEGRLKEIYDDLIDKRGKLANVHMVQSLNPETIVNHMDLYLTVMFGKSPLTRPQREMAAVIVSHNNNCDYCVNHHAQALNHYWKNFDKIKAILVDYETADINEQEKLMCRFAEMQTVSPCENHSIIRQMKDAGLSDRAVLDLTLVTAYFNFVNRIVLALGLDLEQDKGEDYKY